MPRKRLFTDNELRKAISDLKGPYVLGLMKVLGTNASTIYKRLHDISVSPMSSHVLHNEKMENRLLNDYKGQVTLADLAHKYSMSRTTIRQHLFSGIIRTFKFSRVPCPRSLIEYKIARVLLTDKRLMKEPKTIAGILGISAFRVQNYLHRIPKEDKL